MRCKFETIRCPYFDLGCLSTVSKDNARILFFIMTRPSFGIAKTHCKGNLGNKSLNFLNLQLCLVPGKTSILNPKQHHILFCRLNEEISQNISNQIDSSTTICFWLQSALSPSKGKNIVKNYKIKISKSKAFKTSWIKILSNFKQWRSEWTHKKISLMEIVER